MIYLLVYFAKTMWTKLLYICIFEQDLKPALHHGWIVYLPRKCFIVLQTDSAFPEFSTAEFKLFCSDNSLISWSVPSERAMDSHEPLHLEGLLRIYGSCWHGSDTIAPADSVTCLCLALQLNEIRLCIMSSR